MKTALIFVSIPTHFKEMIRVARLLQASSRYSPIVLFADPYGGWEQDAEICRESGIAMQVSHLSESKVAWADLNVQSAGGADRDGFGRRTFTERLPALLRPHVRRIWRPIYRNYWKLHASVWGRERVKQLRLLCAGALLLGRLLARTLFSSGRGRNDAQNVTDRRTPLGRKLVAAFGEIWEAHPQRLQAELRVKRVLYRALPGLLEQRRIALVIVPEDNHLLHTHFYIAAAHAIGAAAVVVPFTVANSLERAEGFFSILNAQVRWPPNMLMAAAFPNWVIEHKGRRLIMPAYEVLVNEYLGLAPAKPWLMNSGFADVVVAAGPYMADYYRRGGLESDRIALVGSLADDELYARLSQADGHRAALHAKLNLPGANRMLLISVPPNQLEGDGRPDCEFGTYESLLRALLGAACGCAGWNVVLSLHPRIYRGGVNFIQEFPCKIAEDDIASLVPLCDLFVASASATIRLAAAAGKATLNYDVFKYRYSDYDGVPGVVTVEDFHAFEEQVRALMQHPARLGKLAESQRKFAAEYALVDGRSGARMLALFDRLTSGGLTLEP